MIVFPNAKINLGLDIISERSDGYHDVSTVMIPVPWCDILEIVPAKGETTALYTSGNVVECKPDNNLVMKAYNALDSITPLPPVDIYLHKIIPDGAGLGGGSADAAYTLRALNSFFALEYSNTDLAQIAGGIGADCPFFIYNRPMLAEGIGEILSPVSIPNTPIFVAIAKPAIHISTAEAYAGTRPALPAIPLREVVEGDMALWKDHASNSFEKSLAHKFPFIEEMKKTFYSAGAFYSSLSGSGSAVYGLFFDDKLAENALSLFPDCKTFSGQI